MLCRIIGLAAVFLLACQDAALPPQEIPTFQRTPRVSSIAGAPVLWKAGENWAWEVRWRGLKVGTARLGVLGEAHALRIESDFRTVGMAKEMRSLRHRLVTRLDGPKHPRDDLHTAFGRLRSWVHPQAKPAKLTLWHERRKYTIDLAQPILDQSEEGQSLRVEGRVRSGSFTLDLTLWLSTDPSHRPMRVTLIHKGQQVNARLLDDESSQGS